jgi:hypothetical protein
MFFNVIYNSPLWKDLDNNTRLMRVFISGCICYILLHSYIFSSYAQTQNILQYRDYIYHFIGLDLASTFYLKQTEKDKKNKTKNKKKKKLTYPDINQLPYLPGNALNDPMNGLMNGQMNGPMNSQMNNNAMQQQLQPTTPPVTENIIDMEDDEEKSREVFITQDEITTNSIPIYKSQADKLRQTTDIESLPVYNATK